MIFNISGRIIRFCHILENVKQELSFKKCQHRLKNCGEKVQIIKQTVSVQPMHGQLVKRFSQSERSHH